MRACSGGDVETAERIVGSDVGALTTRDLGVAFLYVCRFETSAHEDIALLLIEVTRTHLAPDIAECAAPSEGITYCSLSRRGIRCNGCDGWWGYTHAQAYPLHYAHTSCTPTEWG